MNISELCQPETHTAKAGSLDKFTLGHSSSDTDLLLHSPLPSLHQLLLSREPTSRRLIHSLGVTINAPSSSAAGSGRGGTDTSSPLPAPLLSLPMSLSPSSTSPSSLSSPLSLSPHTATAATSATAATTTATTISKDILDPPDTPQLREAIDLCFQLCKDMVQLKSQRMVLDQDKYNTYYDHISNNANHLLDSLRHMEEKPMYSDGIGEEAPAPVSTPTKEGSDYSLIRQIRNLNGTAQTKYRRRSKRNMIGQRCHSCNTTNTPEWRRGPDGARTLCNACGLHYSKLLRKGSFMVQSRHAKLTENSTISIEFDDTVCAEDIQS